MRLAGPSPSLCQSFGTQMSTSRGAIPGAFALDACVDKSTVYIRNNLSVPVRFALSGDIRSVKRIRVNFSTAAIATLQKYTDGLLLVPGDRLAVSFGDSATVRVRDTNAGGFYALAKTAATFFPVPGVQQVNAFAEMVAEIDRAFEKYATCIVGKGTAGRAVCRATQVRDVGFAIGRATFTASVRGLLDTIVSASSFSSWAAAQPGDVLAIAQSPAIIISKPPTAYTGWIVQWLGDTKAQKTAWLVGTDRRRRWIPDIATYNCLKARGVPGPVALPAGTLDALPDLDGIWAKCTNAAPPRPVPQPNRAPLGNFEIASSPAPERVRTRGWMADPDVPKTSIQAVVYVNGKRRASGTANVIRNDIARVYPLYGPKHGFDITFSVAAGKHNVCVYAVNVPNGPNPQLGCKSVTVAAPRPSPPPPIIPAPADLRGISFRITYPPSGQAEQLRCPNTTSFAASADSIAVETLRRSATGWVSRASGGLRSGKRKRLLDTRGRANVDLLLGECSRAQWMADNVGSPRAEGERPRVVLPCRSSSRAKRGVVSAQRVHRLVSRSSDIGIAVLRQRRSLD